MKRVLKILLVIVLLLGVVMFVLLVAQQQSAPPSSGSIVLPDGTWARIEAVTYGTNHLVGPPLAHLASRMPQAVRTFMMRTLGRRAAMRFSHTTSSPTLVVWLNRGVMAGPFPSSTGYLRCVLSGTNGSVSGGEIPYAARYPLETKEFAVFPRREREIILSIYYYDAAGAVFKRGSMTFANPVYHRYPEWKPEPLPATKRAGDVEVTLEKLYTGLEQNHTWKSREGGGQEIIFGTNRLDGGSTTVCRLRAHQLTNTNAVWRIVSSEMSDATGNKIVNNLISLDQIGADGWFICPSALWPDETWKLTCELRCMNGFAPGEQFTFRNVPLGDLNATNRVGWTTNCNGITATLESIVRRAPPTNRLTWLWDLFSQVRLVTSGLTNELRLDCVSARTDNGSRLDNGSWGAAPDSRTGHLDIPTNATTADFTFAVQRSRRVEFLVKPETGTARLEIAPKSKK